MLVTAKQKFVKTSPRKLRYVADVVKKTDSIQTAILILENSHKRAGAVLSKVIKQALANATNNLSLTPSSLKIKELQISGGPIYKRGQPVSRGRFHEIKKRTSHITVILESLEESVKKGAITKWDKK